MRKCVHTSAIDNWFPELCAITLPLIKAWASKIGADFNLISKPMNAPWPPHCEKRQIWEAGMGYDWNIWVDADMIVNPDKMLDSIDDFDPRFFYFEAQLYPSQFYKAHPYFLRDNRNFGISDCFIITSSFTHDLWYPSLFSFEEATSFCTLDPRTVSEFIINLNIARFGLKGLNHIAYDKNHFHLQITDDSNRSFSGGPSKLTKEEHVTRALEIAKQMGINLSQYSFNKV